MNSHLKILAMVAVTALLVPAAAIAKRPEGKPDKGNKHGHFEKAKTPKLKLASANVKGVVTANDGATMTMTVDKASGHAKACKGLSLTFDVSETRFHTADNDADGDMDAMDIRVGDLVKVRTKLALLKGRKTTCAVSEELALPAKAVHNRTTPPVDEADEVDEVDELEETDDVEELEETDEVEELDETGDVEETDEF